MRLQVWIPVVLLASRISAQAPVTAKAPEDVYVWAVKRVDKTAVIEPLLRIHYGGEEAKRVPSFEPIFIDSALETGLDPLRKLLPIGKKLSLFGDGARVGQTQVQAISEEREFCVVPTIKLSTRSTRAKIATTGELAGHASEKKPATSSEIASFSRLTTAWLLQHDLDQKVVNKGRWTPLITTRFYKGGPRSIIGQLDIETELTIYHLFAVANFGQSGPVLTFAELMLQEVEDEKDSFEQSYYDQLDLNNDGVDELITKEFYYENWGYSVFSFFKPQNEWRRVYTGGGCGY